MVRSRLFLPCPPLFRFPSLFLSLDPLLTLSLTFAFTEEMRNLATELQALVQSKVGVSAFSSVWNSITRGRALKRQARRTERVVKVCSNLPSIVSSLLPSSPAFPFLSTSVLFPFLFEPITDLSSSLSLSLRFPRRPPPTPSSRPSASSTSRTRRRSRISARCTASRRPSSGRGR